MTQLIEDVEEEFDAMAILGLYEFTWWQQIGSRPDEHDLIVARAHEAYAVFKERHPDTWLGWITWPGMQPELAQRAEPDTELDFILDSTAQSDAPILVLVDGTVD
ncbi:hypothetical protein J2X46_001283 [Nocardioides sp. BE266]|uniref:hypothetical protein n=1 Tax=Nocardioides sp. BE266 TaxID=2817725 RepID=UPI0028648411|nr:hypothetical protein [Nocardioides sp. BE266]MDR7252307.1 hypothetical protein [Nocardioides sp. BE266]